MRATAEPLEGNKIKLSVQLSEEEVDKAIDDAFRKIARQVNVPGFRPGKAPRKLIESRVGIDAVRQQALSDAIPEYYVQALEETNTDAIEQAQVAITEGEEEGPTVTFEAEVEVRPVPSIVGYENLTVTIPNPVPKEEEIDEQIERMRKQYGELEPVEREARTGDFVTIDINGTHEGEPVPGLTASGYSYEVGTALASLGENFDQQIEGSKAGDVLEFTTPVPPNDEDVEFRIEVKQVSERVLPELTDEWANEVSEFETVEELRADISSRMSQVRKIEANRALRNGTIEVLADLVDEELPEALVAREASRALQEFAGRLEQQGIGLEQYLQFSGKDQGEFIEELKGNASASVRADLALRSLADKEDLQASAEEIDTQIEMIADEVGQKVAKVRRELERNGQMAAVRSDIRMGKAVRWLMDNVEVVDADGQVIDRDSLRLGTGTAGSGTDEEAHEGETEA